MQAIGDAYSARTSIAFASSCRYSPSHPTPSKKRLGSFSWRAKLQWMIGVRPLNGLLHSDSSDDINSDGRFGGLRPLQSLFLLLHLD